MLAQYYYTYIYNTFTTFKLAVDIEFGLHHSFIVWNSSIYFEFIRDDTHTHTHSHINKIFVLVYFGLFLVERLPICSSLYLYPFVSLLMMCNSTQTSISVILFWNDTSAKIQEFFTLANYLLFSDKVFWNLLFCFVASNACFLVFLRAFFYFSQFLYDHHPTPSSSGIPCTVATHSKLCSFIHLNAMRHYCVYSIYVINSTKNPVNRLQ